jgi:cystathionine beta-lyase
MMPGHTFTPYLACDADTSGDVALHSATKGWNLPGLKCAQLIAGSDALAEQLLTSIPVEVQHGAGHLGAIAAVAAYDHGQAWLDRITTTIDGNHRLLAELLAEKLPGITHDVPPATYLAWLDLRPLDLGEDPAAVLLERGRLAVNSGVPFGAPGWVRVNLGTSPAVVREIVDRMAASVTP